MAPCPSEDTYLETLALAWLQEAEGDWLAHMEFGADGDAKEAWDKALQTKAGAAL